MLDKDQERQLEDMARNEKAHETDALIKKPDASGTVFWKGKRIKMNIVAMYLNTLVPWIVFVLCFMIVSFSLMHYHPVLAWSLIGCFVLLWIGSVYKAFRARKDDPDPTWYTYFAFALAASIIFGTVLGYYNYKTFMEPYFELSTMKIAGAGAGAGAQGSLQGGIDLSTTPAQSLMDAGLVKFAPGTTVLRGSSSHFRYKANYCVAPVVGPGQSTMKLASYDIWVVGKNCCEVASNDYRCGAWDKPAWSTLAVRVMNDADLQYYYLATQQAAGIYNIQVNSPMFFYQTPDLVGSMLGQSRANSAGSAGSAGTANGAGSASGVGSASASVSGQSVNGVPTWQAGATSLTSSSPLDALKDQAYNHFLFWSGVAAIVALFCMCMVSVGFSFLGRRSSAKDYADDLAEQTLKTHNVDTHVQRQYA